MELDLLPGESRGYWKYHAPGKWFKQTNQEQQREGHSLIPAQRSQSRILPLLVRERIHDRRRTRIKITLAGAYVYYFDAWGGDLTGQGAIFGMDFMVSAGIRLDLADGSLCLPDEVRIQLSGRRQLFSGNSRRFTFDQHGNDPWRSLSDKQKLWVTRGDRWVPTVVRGLGRTQYLRITNVSNQPITLQRDTRIGIWLAGDHVPRTPGYVSVGSRRYAEWQNLAFQATADETPIEDSGEVVIEPPDDSPQYNAPTEILKKEPKPRKLMSIQPSPCVEMKIEEPVAGDEPLKSKSVDADHVATEGTRVDQEQIEPMSHSSWSASSPS
ncbi:LOW QUALITY PROTEIN: hypothetical protein PHMEG_00024583 [Phytophthora megakarya]|uniref:Aspartic protease n=1 Tax=Phytophthora megakarya TaxID=4795 RepID=A0A225VE49_9STRA|nr:LOW QUALITY PROTEIN: hypothetical protein PHMEG_00024583 [Phytophthora megakarya]